MNGTFALVFVQILAVILCAVAAVLLFTRASALQQAQARIENACTAANMTADLAKREVEAINTTKYEAIKSLLQACETRSNSAVNLVGSIEESLKTVQNKLASRERQEKNADKKSAKIKGEGEDPEDTGAVNREIEDLVNNGRAFPLSSAPPPQAAPQQRRRFGASPLEV